MDAESVANLAEALRSQAAPSAGYGGIWPENADTVHAFLCVQSQWRTATIGGGFGPSVVLYLGLDYASVRVALDAMQIAVTPDLWSGLHVMEAEACAVLNER